MLQAGKLLTALCEADVAFVIVGGMAAVAHGSAYVTADLDICYLRQPDNYARLSRALRPFQPRLRDAPAHLPFTLDDNTLKAGLNFTLVTEAGDFDLMGEIAGLGDYGAVNALAEDLVLFGHRIRVLSLTGLIRSKEAAGRPKDLRLLTELKALQALRGEPPESAG